jgi:hypothetical protein
VGDVHPLQQTVCARAALPRGNPEQHQGKLHVFADTQSGQQMEKLEHISEPAPPQERHRIPAQLREVLPLNQNVSRVGPVDTPDNLKASSSRFPKALSRQDALPETN